MEKSVEVEGSKCGCRLAGLQYILGLMGDDELGVVFEEYVGYVRKFAFFDFSSKEWYMDGTQCVRMAMGSSLELRMGEGEEDYLFPLGELSKVSLRPFFELSDKEVGLMGKVVGCRCESEEYLGLYRRYWRSVLQSCEGDVSGGGYVGYQYLYLYEEVFRSAGWSLKRVCEELVKGEGGGGGGDD
jgi:hypothetical protein